MLAFTIRRIALLVPVLLGISIIAFLLIHLAPGDPAIAILGFLATPEMIAQFRAKYGLDQGIVIQYLSWLHATLTGDLGISIAQTLPVSQILPGRILPTLLLTTLAALLAFPAGIGGGMLAALRRGRLTDSVSRILWLAGLSMPSFWLALLLLLFFGVGLKLVPVSGYVPIEKDPIASFRSLILPAVTLAIPMAAVISRVVRTSMLEVMERDYIRTARSKGLREPIVVLRHTLRNVALPTLTTAGLMIGYLLGGAILVETVFTIPGMGRLLVESVHNRDYAVIQGIVLFTAFAAVLVGLFVDLLYVYFDPRVRLR